MISEFGAFPERIEVAKKRVEAATKRAEHMEKRAEAAQESEDIKGSQILSETLVSESAGYVSGSSASNLAESKPLSDNIPSDDSAAAHQPLLSSSHSDSHIDAAPEVETVEAGNIGGTTEPEMKGVEPSDGTVLESEDQAFSTLEVGGQDVSGTHCHDILVSSADTSATVEGPLEHELLHKYSFGEGDTSEDNDDDGERDGNSKKGIAVEIDSEFPPVLLQPYPLPKFDIDSLVGTEVLLGIEGNEDSGTSGVQSNIIELQYLSDSLGFGMQVRLKI